MFIPHSDEPLKAQLNQITYFSFSFSDSIPGNNNPMDIFGLACNAIEIIPKKILRQFSYLFCVERYIFFVMGMSMFVCLLFYVLATSKVRYVCVTR